MDVASASTVALGRQASRARLWLLDHALPLWEERGVDRDRGGFFERLTLTGVPDEADRRARVAARQVYCFAQSIALGFEGLDTVRHGIEGLLGSALRPDGLIVHRVRPDGTALDSGPDLYDQAFFLLALAKAHPLLPERHLDRVAERVITTLRETFAHRAGGFEDALPSRSPLRANPHMHLFEAALAWIEIAPEVPTWRTLAAEMYDLMKGRFLDPNSGALLEFFEEDWTPVPPDRQALEPGHHFEWAWLLLRWQDLSGIETRAMATRLFELGERHGVDRVRGVAIDTLGWPDFAPRSQEARLWPQTERLKASLTLARTSRGGEKEQALSAAVSASEALERYLSVPLPGLWRDRMKGDGTFVVESAPASSFYHIACAYSELFAGV